MRLVLLLFVVAGPSLTLAGPRQYQKALPEAAVEPVDANTVTARFKAECDPRPKGEACAKLRRELESAFLQDLLDLRESGNPIDVDLYRAAASAESPFLAVLGLRGIGMKRPLADADRALVLAALDSPYPAVRLTAVRFLESPATDNYRKRFDRGYGDGSLNDQNAWMRGAKDPVLEEKGVPVYPGARYRFFASGPRRAFYTTRDTPEQVLAFYTKGGKKTYSGDELKKMLSTSPVMDQATIMELARKDPTKLQEQMKKLSSTPRIDWTDGIHGEPGIVDARFVVLDQVEAFGAITPTRLVAIFKDEYLGATAIVVPHAPVVPGSK